MAMSAGAQHRTNHSRQVGGQALRRSPHAEIAPVIALHEIDNGAAKPLPALVLICTRTALLSRSWFHPDGSPDR